MSDEKTERMLRYAAECSGRRWFLPGNISSPLKRAGLIRAWHQGWGVYAFEFTETGRLALNPEGHPR